MNGVHDMGGMHGFGSIDPGPGDAEPPFHADWERRTFALSLATAALGLWSIDASRHARERLEPVTYLRSRYYEKWLSGLRTLLLDAGVATNEELDRGVAEGATTADISARRLTAARVPAVLARGEPFTVEPSTAPRFAPGDKIRVRSVTTEGHTRAVGYARGRFGIVRAHRGCHVFPDRSAHGANGAEHLYGVAFAARELWGEAGSPKDTVHIDLWEPYLEAAP